MTKQMTPAQRRAVESVAGDLAISAGAGSGKTMVLAHRFAKALEAAADASWAPAHVDRILTITFTNKAAGEIAERVRRVVNSEVSVEAGRRISEAWISTIHTFCGRLVRRHLLETGIDPRFRQLDDVAAAMLKTEAFEAAAARHYGSHDGVTALLERSTLPVLRTDVISVHDSVRAMGLDPRGTTVPDGRDELDSLKLEVHRRAELLAAEMEACSQTATIVAKRTSLDSWRTALGSCALGDDNACDMLLGLRDAYEIKGLRGQANQANRELRAALEDLSAAAAAVMRKAELAGFEVLVRAFAREYAHIKEQRSAVDFDDLQELAAALLEAHPVLAARYRDHFRMLMIDEFQDTNDLQMRVLQPLRNNNLCIVGDERQSIYGFRYADVETFGRLRAEINHREELRDNFRSHPAILGFVNGAFSQSHLFGPAFMQLRAGNDGPWRSLVPHEAPRVEVLLVDTAGVSKGDAVATEAQALARRIANIIGGGIRGGDIAVLLRNATNAAVFASALEAQGVSVLVSAGVELFDAPEVGEIISLLRSIAVPGDDEALAAVLASRMVRLSDDALLALRVAAGKGSLWSALEAAAESTSGSVTLAADDAVAARKAYRVLARANSKQGAVTLHELIHEVCEALDYDLTLFSLGPLGLRAWANVQKVVRYAEQYETAESGDVAAFAEYLAVRSAGSKDKAAPAEAGDDVVRIMTVHGAKGLEFPVVFAADMGALKGRAPGAALVSKAQTDGGCVPVVGLRLSSCDDEPKAATAQHLRFGSTQQKRELEEQKRCLYVACTRAEELLVISGATKLSAPAEEGVAIIDWLRESLGDPAETAVVQCGDSQVGVRIVEPHETETGRVDRTVPPGAPLAVDEELRVDVGSLTPRPKQISYSAMRNHEQCPLSYHVRSVAPLGAFRDPAARTASDFGSALHAVMQTAGPATPSPGAIEAAIRRYRLDEDGAVRLEAATASFFASSLARRLACSEHIKREEPIRLAFGTTALVGNIDALAWTGRQALIVDYKTGSAPDPKASSRHAGYELQAKCYALGAIEAGADSVEAAFCFVEHGAIEVGFSFSATQVGDIRTEIESRIQAMTTDTSTHLAEYDPEVCASCPALGGVCPIERP